MKNKIAQAAIQEIMQRGLRFSIRDLTGRLGISTKTLYQHFESKEQIIAFLVEQSVLDMQRSEREIINNPKLTTQQKLFEALVTIPSGYAFSDLRAINELKNGYPDQWRMMDDYMNQGWDNIRLLVQTGVEEGVLRPFDIDLFIGLYAGGLNYFMDNHAAAHHGLTLEKALQEMVKIMISGICVDQTVKGEVKQI